MSRLIDLQIGESLSDIRLHPVNRLDLIKYAGASGDFNPIHTIDEEAKNAGLPGIIAHGMWTMGNLVKLFTPHVEDGFVKDYFIRFKGMVFLNDTLTLKAIVTEKKADEIFFNVVAVNQNQKEVMGGQVGFKIY